MPDVVTGNRENLPEELKTVVFRYQQYYLLKFSKEGELEKEDREEYSKLFNKINDAVIQYHNNNKIYPDKLEVLFSFYLEKPPNELVKESRLSDKAKEGSFNYEVKNDFSFTSRLTYSANCRLDMEKTWEWNCVTM